MNAIQRICTLFVVAILVASCGANSSKSADSQRATNGEAKYVFYFIGDGMTASQVRLGEAALTSTAFAQNYAIQTSATDVRDALYLKSLAVTGLATSNAANRYITDSAAAGTALATGGKTNVGVIGKDPDGNDLKTIAERAKEKGMKVGIVSSVSIDHATPASFYAHTMSRSRYEEISNQLLTSGFDYFAGGSVKWNARAKVEGTDLATAYASYKERAEEMGFKFVTTKAEFDNVGRGETMPIIATLDKLANEQDCSDDSALPYTIDLSKQTNEDNKITLAQFTQKGIELLDNEAGFFMMVEGGKIDWTCHANDAASCAYEVVAFDEAIGVAMQFAALHPDETLIVVTGDHDCGGLAIGFAGTGYDSAFDILAHSTTSYSLFTEAAVRKIGAGESFDKLLAFACEQFGFTNDVTGDKEVQVVQTAELSDIEVKLLKEAYVKSQKKINNIKLDDIDIYNTLYSYYDPFTTTCTNLLNNKAGVGFTSFSHTAVPVMVFADGANAHLFSGYYDNTDIAIKIALAAGL